MYRSFRVRRLDLDLDLPGKRPVQSLEEPGFSKCRSALAVALGVACKLRRLCSYFRLMAP